MFEKSAQQAPAVNWSYRPYRPLMTEVGEIYVTQIVPKPTSVEISWMVEDAQNVDVYIRKQGEEEFGCVLGFAGGTAVVSDLEEGCDYEFYLKGADGAKSLVRLVRTGDYIGVPVQYLHPKDKVYGFSGSFLGSPSMVRQPDGSLLASMDVFRCDGKGSQNLTLIYRSDDDGATWQWQCELYPCFWGKLFLYRGEVYMLACSTEHGDILLGKTLDGGKSFTTPAVLVRGSGLPWVAGPDMSPEPPVEYKGRLWINFHWGSWDTWTHHACIASAPADSDLMDPANWTVTPPCVYDESWPGTAKGHSRGTLEGTFMVLDDQELYLLARYEIKECEPDYGLALLYKVHTDDPAAPLEYVRTIPFEGNHSKFTVLQDEKSGAYYSIVSRIRESKYKSDRNLLSLVKSQDGLTWTTVTDLIDLTDRDGEKTGVQYVEFFLEGEDLYYLCRAGLNGSDSYHNSNAIFFKRIRDYRSLG